MKSGIIAIIMAITTLTSYTTFTDCVEGNGNMKTESRAAVPFTAIANDASFKVIYLEDDEYTITVEAESNILPYIETEIKRGALGIGTISGAPCLRYTTQPIITVTAPSIRELVSSGSGDIVAVHLDGEEVTLAASGSGDIIAGEITASETSIVISGSGNIMTDDIASKMVKATLSGSGNLAMSGRTVTSRYAVTASGSIYSRELVTDGATVTMVGSGTVYTAVKDHLDLVISGSGNLYLQGNPAVNITRSGSGQIINL